MDYTRTIRKASENLALSEYQAALARIAKMFPMPEDTIKIEPATALVNESPNRLTYSNDCKCYSSGGSSVRSCAKGDAGS